MNQKTPPELTTTTTVATTDLLLKWPAGGPLEAIAADDFFDSANVNIPTFANKANITFDNVIQQGVARSNLNGGVEIRVDDFPDATYPTDIAKINAAFAFLRDNTFYMGAYGAAVIFSARAYEITSSINATMISQGPWSVVANGAIFLGTCTGKPMFDFLGSRFMSWEGGFFNGATATKPWSAVMIGRFGDGSANCDCMSFTNVHAWGYYEKAAKVNVASETSVDMNCRWWNQNTASTATGMIWDGYNFFNSPSDFVTEVTPGTYMSCIQHTITSLDVRKDGDGEALWFIGTHQVGIQNGYAACAGNAAVCLFTDIDEDPLASGALRWNIDMHVETNALEYLLDIRQGYGTTQTITDLTWREMGCQVTQAAIHAGTGITSVTIRDADIKIDHQLTPLVSGLCAPTGVFNITGRVAMSPANLANVTFTGDVECAGTVTQPAAGSFRLIDKGASAPAASTFPFTIQSYGLFDNFGKSTQRLTITDTDVADNMPRVGSHIQLYSEGAGLGAGYPQNSRIAYSAFLHKGLTGGSWLTDNTPGQMDGYQVVVRQGVGDSGAFLHQGRFREGYMATLEGSVTRVNTSDVAQQSVTVQAGTLDQVSGNMGGFLARAEVGTGLRGYSCTQAVGASWSRPFYFENSSGTPLFTVDGSGFIVGQKLTLPGGEVQSTWADWVPTITAPGGTAPTVTVNAARWISQGKEARMRLDLTITAIGTGTGALQVTTPVTFASRAGEMIGREETTALGLGADISGSGLTIRGFTNTGLINANPVVVGYRLILWGGGELA